MGLLSGSITGRRFRVVGSPPTGWPAIFADRLETKAFKDPPVAQRAEEVEGWVRVQNLLHTDFDDTNLWLFGAYALFSLRIDKKTLPARLLAATVAVEAEKWAAERGVERVPSAIKKEIKERIEEQWLDRALPTVRTVEIGWHVTEGWAIVTTHADKVIDRVRKRFRQTFGFDLVPASPLDALQPDQQKALLDVSPFVLRE